MVQHFLSISRTLKFGDHRLTTSKLWTCGYQFFFVPQVQKIMLHVHRCFFVILSLAIFKLNSVKQKRKLQFFLFFFFFNFHEVKIKVYYTRDFTPVIGYVNVVTGAKVKKSLLPYDVGYMQRIFK